MMEMEVYLEGPIVEAAKRHDKQIDLIAETLDALIDRVNRLESKLESKLEALETPKKEE